MTSVKFVEMPVTNYNPSLYLFHYMIRFIKGVTIWYKTLSTDLLKVEH